MLSWPSLLNQVSANSSFFCLHRPQVVQPWKSSSNELIVADQLLQPGLWGVSQTMTLADAFFSSCLLRRWTEAASSWWVYCQGTAWGFHEHLHVGERKFSSHTVSSTRPAGCLSIRQTGERIYTDNKDGVCSSVEQNSSLATFLWAGLSPECAPFFFLWSNLHKSWR